jgi:uncharacterized membrane protein YciS (DUF1049 family)
MVKTLFRIYAVLAALFGMGMLLSMIIGPPGMSTILACGFLWCAVGMFFNSPVFARLTERIDKLWEKRE